MEKCISRAFARHTGRRAHDERHTQIGKRRAELAEQAPVHRLQTADHACLPAAHEARVEPRPAFLLGLEGEPDDLVDEVLL